MSIIRFTLLLIFSTHALAGAQLTQCLEKLFKQSESYTPEYKVTKFDESAYTKQRETLLDEYNKNKGDFVFANHGNKHTNGNTNAAQYDLNFLKKFSTPDEYKGLNLAPPGKGGHKNFEEALTNIDVNENVLYFYKGGGGGAEKGNIIKVVKMDEVVGSYQTAKGQENAKYVIVEITRGENLKHIHGRPFKPCENCASPVKLRDINSSIKDIHKHNVYTIYKRLQDKQYIVNMSGGNVPALNKLDDIFKSEMNKVADEIKNVNYDALKNKTTRSAKEEKLLKAYEVNQKIEDQRKLGNEIINTIGDTQEGMIKFEQTVAEENRLLQEYQNLSFDIMSEGKSFDELMKYSDQVDDPIVSEIYNGVIDYSNFLDESSGGIKASELTGQ